MTSRQAFEEKMEEKIKSFTAKIEKLKNEPIRAEPKDQAKYYAQIEELFSKLFSAKQAFRISKETRDEVWESLKMQVEDACVDLDNSVKDTADRFS